MQELIKSSIGLVSDAVLVVAGFALLAFLWGMAKSVFKVGGSESAVEEGRRTMVWGLIALFVMISVWGIISLFQRDLDLTQGSIILPGEHVLREPTPEVRE